jgi:hypothetical protein
MRYAAILSLPVLVLGLALGGCQTARRAGPADEAVPLPVLEGPVPMAQPYLAAAPDPLPAGPQAMTCTGSVCMVPTPCPSCGVLMGMVKVGDQVALRCPRCGKIVAVPQ